jgi:predicted DNA-binding protein YlxM (UPF0122 family)
LVLKFGVSVCHIGRELSKDELMELLEINDWNKAEVARRLGVSRRAVWKYMKKWEIPLQRPAKYIRIQIRRSRKKSEKRPFYESV